MKFLILTIVFTIFLTHTVNADDNDPYLSVRKEMVQAQIRARGIKNPDVLNAMLNVKRHLFVPGNLQSRAYNDNPLPIGYSQTISQPYIVAFMTDSLNLNQKDRVLEIGTGSGYQAAVLAQIVKEVYTIEIVPELAQSAKKRLYNLGYNNIHVKHGDGFQGWPEQAPFDAIIVTAAPTEIPPKLLEQLKVGGKMIIPVGSIEQNLYLLKKSDKGLKQTRILPVRFVPMVREPIP